MLVKIGDGGPLAVQGVVHSGVDGARHLEVEVEGGRGVGRCFLSWMEWIEKDKWLNYTTTPNLPTGGRPGIVCTDCLTLTEICLEDAL